MKGFHCCLLLILALVGSLENLNLVCSAADPTDGFTPVPLTEANFELQKPYNIPLNERYSYEDGVRHMWVYATDKPHDPNSRTQPRTEVRMKVTRPPSSYPFYLRKIDRHDYITKCLVG